MTINMVIFMIYYEKLRAIREDNDLTQSQIAIILNTNQRRISRIETGTSELTINELILYCEYFKISSDWLLNIGYYKEN